MKLTARVPATSANLGPGFDCFGLALDLWNDVHGRHRRRAGRDVGGARAPASSPPTGPTWSRRRWRTPRAWGGGIVPCGRAARREPDPARARARIVGGRLRGGDLARGPAARPGSGARGGAGAGDRDRGPSRQRGRRDRRGVHAGVRRRRDPARPAPGPPPVAFVPIDIRLPTGEARAALPSIWYRSADAVLNAGHAAATVVAMTSEPGLLTQTLGDRLARTDPSEIGPERRARSSISSALRMSPSVSRAPARPCSRSSTTACRCPTRATAGRSCGSASPPQASRSSTPDTGMHRAGPLDWEPSWSRSPTSPTRMSARRTSCRT